jgi:hypothetical protein
MLFAFAAETAFSVLLFHDDLEVFLEFKLCALSLNSDDGSEPE